MESKLIGRYRIVGDLGRGAMGTVYRAVDPLIEREVAIKTLHPDLPEEIMGEVRERFLREAKSAGRLNHPNIVIVYDVGDDGNVAYIAMELLEGRSLQQMLRDPDRLPFQVIAELAAQVADALDHAQRYTIVHRDVKPANVMVSAAGRAKLTDFGVAYVPSSTMTRAGMTIGSPKYMSPEQVLALPVDPRSDIFSLGVVLYEMLARRTPFERPGDTNLYTLMQRIAQDPYQPVTQLDATIPAAFDHVLARALAKSPDARYSRAGEMAEDLRNLRKVRAPGVGSRAGDDSTPLPREAPGIADASTLRIAGAPGAANLVTGTQTASGLSTHDLLADIEAFSRRFDEEQARERAEVEERHRREEEEARRRAEAEAESRAARPADSAEQREGPAPSVLDMLRKQATSRPAAGIDAPRRAEVKSSVSGNMRSAMRFLVELAQELNRATPTTDRSYEFIYLDDAPPLVLSDAFADYRLRKVDGDEVCGHVFLRYRAQYARPAVMELSGADIEHCRRLLDGARIPFEFSGTKKNDFGQPVRGTFKLSGVFSCQIVLRADYEAPAIQIELLNAGRIGTWHCRIAPEELTGSFVEQIAAYLLGGPSDFARRVTR